MKIKSGLFLRIGVLGLLVGSVFCFNQGCTGKAPVAAVFAIPPPVPKANNIIDDFEDGNASMSVDLKGAASDPTTVINYILADPLDPNSAMVAQPVVVAPVPLGSWVGSSWSGNTVNSPYVFCDGTGANGSKCYTRLFGPILDLGNGTYPAFQLEGKFLGVARYDASTFTGIRFYLNVPSADTCPSRRFSIATIWSLPPAEGGNGTCTACYDHYGANLPVGSTGGWALRTYTFSSLTKVGFGAPSMPASMPASVTTDFVKLVFQYGRNGAAGSSVVDYAVDDFSFF